MPEKVDYLRDLADHPTSTGAEAAARLDVPQPTVLEAYRRARRQKLVESDDGRPQRFSLTELGRERLLVLERGKAEASESNPDGNSGRSSSTVSTNSEQALTLLKESVDDLEADMRVVVRLMANRSQSEADAGREGRAEREKDSPRRLTDEIDELISNTDAVAESRPAQEEASQRRLVAELFEARRELGEMGWFDDKAPMKEKIERLKEQLPPGVPQAVERLLELESEAEFWGSGDEVESEAAWLRERLELPPVEDAEEEGAEEEGAEEESGNSEE